MDEFLILDFYKSLDLRCQDCDALRLQNVVLLGLKLLQPSEESELRFED